MKARLLTPLEENAIRFSGTFFCYNKAGHSRVSAGRQMVEDDESTVVSYNTNCGPRVRDCSYDVETNAMSYK